MKKTFISNLILLMSVNLLIKPFWILGIDRGVQNHVGYEQYGIYANLFGFSMLFITLLDLGINTYTSSNVAKDKDKLQQEFAALTVFKLISSSIYLIITLGLGYLNGFRDLRIYLLLFLGLNQILSYFYSYFRSIVGGLQLFKIDSLLSVVDRSLMIVLCGAMLWFGFSTMTITHFVYAQTVAYSVAVLISFFVIKPHLKQLQWTFNKSLLLKVVRQMAPYALLSLIMTFYTRLDVVLLQKLLPDGDIQNGIYASAYRLLEAANMMAALVSMLLLPIFSKMLSNRENVNPLVQFTTVIMILPASLFSLCCFIYKQPIIHLLNQHSTDYSGDVFGWVILCFVPLSTMYVYGTLMTANGNLRTLNILAAIGLIINLILNFWLIHTIKAEGAGIAALCTQGFVGISNFIWGKKILKIQFEDYFALKFIGLIVILILIGSLISLMEVSILPGIATLGSILLLGLFGLKLIDIKQGLNIASWRFTEKNSK